MSIGRKTGLIFMAVLAAGLFLVAGRIYVQDLAAVRQAKAVDAVITAYCRETGTLPVRSLIRSKFPALTTDAGWFLFGDDESYLKVQYPMRWWNGAAIGRPQLSEFTATVYSYSVTYDCKRAN